jgi:hypothetical protein
LKLLISTVCPSATMNMLCMVAHPYQATERDTKPAKHPIAKTASTARETEYLMPAAESDDHSFQVGVDPRIPGVRAVETGLVAVQKRWFRILNPKNA